MGAYAVALVPLAAALILDVGPLSRDWWDGWGYNTMETVAAVLVLAAAATRSPARAAWAVLGTGMLSSAAGDWLYTLGDYADGQTFPSPVDALWLAMYPLQALTAVLLLRSETRRFKRSMWLDGLVAGLGVAAVASLALDPIRRSATGSTGAVLALMAYPFGDLLAIALVVGAMATLGWPWRSRWGWLGLGFVLAGAADLVYLLLASRGTYTDGSIIDAAWPLSFLLLARAAWQQRPGRAPADERAGVRLLTVPAFVTVACLAVLLSDTSQVLVRLLAAAAVLAVVVRTALTFREVAELAETRRQAVTDDLTGLSNRRQMFRRLEALLEGRNPGDHAALLLLDLDRFKEVNDALGHSLGDQLLRQLATRLATELQGRLGPHGVLARLGGDEFAVLLDGADRATAEEVAVAVREAMQDAFPLDGVTLHVDGSVGVALCPDHAATRTALLRCADVAMYQAKRTRTGHAVYAADADQHDRARLETIEQLRHAVENGELVCYYQPKADLRTGRIVGAEALVRWEHPERGLLAPDAFLPLAEQTGLMRPLTDVVLAQALADCRSWRDAGQDLTVAVNLSVSSLVDANLPAQVVGLLRRQRLPASALELEITESVLMADPERARETVDRLRTLGVAVSVDDYGTGYSSLAYLRGLRLDELKLDRTFVAGLGHDDRDVAIVRSTIELAHALGLRLVAEGVETADDWHVLRRLGCDLAQGYYLSRPVPPTAFLTDILRRNEARDRASGGSVDLVAGTRAGR